MLVHAQPAPTATPGVERDVVRAVAQASLDTNDVDVGQNIEDQINIYLDKSGLRERQLRHEIEILKGTSAVLVPSTSRDSVMSARQPMTMRYCKPRRTMSGSKICKSLTTQPRPISCGGSGTAALEAVREPGKQAELIRKVVALAGGRLDGELRNLGINPKEYEEAPPPQRYLQMQNALKRETVRHAYGDLVGLVPLQTFEGHDGRGNYTIGVVAVVSPSLKELAGQVATAHGQFQPDPARAQDLKQVYGDPAKLIRDFGIRRMFDPAGLPVLISFAQWASDYAGNDPAVAQEYRGVAVQQAQARADGQIAQFLKGTMNVDEKSETDLEKQAERLPDGYVQDDAATKAVTSSLLATIRNHASVQATGIQTLYTWSRKHPDTGKQIVGVIRMWSAAGEKATRELRDQHRVPATSAAVTESPHGSPSVQQGRDLMNISDF